MGRLARLSLLSFRVIKGCCFAICSVRSSMLSSWAMDLGGVGAGFLVGGCDAVP